MAIRNMRVVPVMFHSGDTYCLLQAELNIPTPHPYFDDLAVIIRLKIVICHRGKSVRLRLYGSSTEIKKMYIADISGFGVRRFF